jgi:hypothetical protein
MIECPTCKTSFNPRYRVCPRCGTYEAKLEDRIEYLADTAEIALDQGAASADVEVMLVDEGLAPLMASEIVSARARKVKRTERSYGLVRLFGGLGLVLVAGVIAAIGAFSLPSRFGWRMLIAGVGLALAGAWPLTLGIYSTVTGRDGAAR